MSEADGILRLRQPISVTYNWSAGPNATSHLNGLLNGTLIGKRCPGCSLVYFPPRNGVCPKCARILGDDVVVGPRGTITTFCVVNVPFLGQKIKLP
ncbi:MAG: Zn-ribbon domain-containing OB-fold protein, partial [Ilumatobacteraceae bacterium]